MLTAARQTDLIRSVGNSTWAGSRFLRLIFAIAFSYD
jgi:hypothetical protein